VTALGAPWEASCIATMPAFTSPTRAAHSAESSGNDGSASGDGAGLWAARAARLVRALLLMERGKGGKRPGTRTPSAGTFSLMAMLIPSVRSTDFVPLALQRTFVKCAATS
jgi:hypothetical protein